MSELREEMLASKLQEFGLDSFPDNQDVTWHARGFAHKGDYSFMEAEPVPATVGYPRFKFVVSFKKPAEPLVAGCYCLENGKWLLLFSDPNVPSDWKALGC